MTLSEAQAWVLIITAVGGMAVSILAAVQTRARLHETQGTVQQVSHQVEEVYQLTDKKLTEQQALFEKLYGRIGDLTKEGLDILMEPAR
jgi:hypothetical protein